MVHDREPGFPELEGAIVARSGEGSLPIRGLTSMERLKCGSTRCWLSLPPCNGVVNGLQSQSSIWFGAKKLSRLETGFCVGSKIMNDVP